MSENKAQSFLRSALVIGPSDRMERVENLLVDGMPDVNCCIEGKEFWVENKEPKEPKRLSTPLFGSNHKFSQSQLNWFLAQRRAGGNAFAFIWTDRRGILLKSDHVELANSMDMRDFENLALWMQFKPVKADQRAALREIVLSQCK